MHKICDKIVKHFNFFPNGFYVERIVPGACEIPCKKLSHRIITYEEALTRSMAINKC